LIADPAYQLAVCTDDLEALGLRVDRQPAIGVDVLVFALLSIQENAPTTANLLAPVVINLSTRHGLQAIRYDAVYSHAQALTLRTGECSC
jgi:flagellar assembly factor FliW